MPSRNEDQLAKTVGKAIARYRQLCGLTQDELAERLEIGKENERIKAEVERRKQRD